MIDLPRHVETHEEASREGFQMKPATAETIVGHQLPSGLVRAGLNFLRGRAA
jgi:hypothetical protein